MDKAPNTVFVLRYNYDDGSGGEIEHVYPASERAIAEHVFALLKEHASCFKEWTLEEMPLTEFNAESPTP